MFICIKSIIVLCKNKKENKLILFYSILFYFSQGFQINFRIEKSISSHLHTLTLVNLGL
jgi:hypothetical protein